MCFWKRAINEGGRNINIEQTVILFEKQEDYWFLYTQFWSLCVCEDSRISFKRRWCASRSGEKVERSCSKINYAKYFPSSEYEIVAASSLYTRRKLNLLSHCKLYSSRKKITSFCLMNILVNQVNCSEATANMH